MVSGRNILLPHVLKNVLSRLLCRDRPDVPTWHGPLESSSPASEVGWGSGENDFRMIENGAGQKEKRHLVGSASSCYIMPAKNY